MNLLLDSHLLIWSSSSSKRLSLAARSLINNSDNDLFFSAASLWELAIKQGSERKGFHVDVLLLRQGLLENGYNEISVTSDHAIATRALPAIHKDPFDRILIAQAIVEDLILLTADSVVARYPGPIKKV
ncbi:MAG: type II toxin-antitoxin system VapC family toxin [Edaphobacter sp.]